MPRKRRNKKDPIAQKLVYVYDEEPNEPSNNVNDCGSNGISQGETDQDNVGDVFSPEADALPTASEQPGCAEVIPTDFAHRDRLRFGRPYGSTEEDTGDGSPRRFLFTCVCLICLILIVQWLKSEGYNLLLTWYFDLLADMETDENNIKRDKVSSYFGLSAFGFLWSLLLSFLLGASCLFFSWGMTYQDSLQPGQFPPSPVSPKKYRKQSGHTFHSSYVMAFVNGVAVFALSAWWLCT